MTPSEKRKAIQRILGVNDDGIFGEKVTWPALRALAVAKDTERIAVYTIDTAPKFPPLAGDNRARVLGGPFRWVAAPTRENPEAIQILDGWADKNLVRVEIPQLAKIGNGNFKAMTLNKRVVDQTLALWAAWEKAGLLQFIRTYDGAFVARLIRGSKTQLSNHCYGSAFDLNYEWNKLGKVPAAAGAVGSVRELVPLAHQHGYYWGGNFSRLDGMHFEVAQVLS